jgi:phosphate transport system permease protein
VAPTTRAKKRPGDLILAGVSWAAGVLILVALAGVAIFLTIEGAPAFHASSDAYFGAANLVAYVWPLLFGTVLAATLALLIATPLSLGVALVISHYAPRKLARSVGYAIDLLAAVPSVVYGLWGIGYLGRHLTPVYEWLEKYLGFLPFFAGPASATGKTILTAGIVLAIMAIPIITAITREVFLQTPTLHQEAALALGATRWEMIRMAVFPYARSGIVSAVMLGMGRALGETIAVLLIISPAFDVKGRIFEVGGNTVSSLIAGRFGDASKTQLSALLAAGFVLFLITLLVNTVAAVIVNRSRSGAGTDA